MSMSAIQRTHFRVAIVRRDGPNCFWCDCRTNLDGAYTWEGTPLKKGRNLRRRTLDHLIPQASGGRDHLPNLVIACYSCNHDRGNMPAVEWATKMGKLDKLIDLLERVLTMPAAFATVPPYEVEGETSGA